MDADERGFGNLRFSAALCVYLRSLWPKRKRQVAWEQEQEFICQWGRKGPVAGRRTWRREDLYERPHESPAESAENAQVSAG